MSAYVSEMKPAIMTIWSAQVAQAERLIKNCRTHEARQAAHLSVANLSWTIRGMLGESIEAWEATDTGRIAEVITHDMRQLQMLIYRMEGK